MVVRTFTKPISLEETLARKLEESLNMTSAPKQNTAVLNGGTFANQDKLPKLPIPDLESTCQKYLAALKPLQTHREHADTEAAVKKFLKTDGPELHERLKKYATGKTSYIEQFCRYLAFLPNLD
jgi:carnitine O-acetyltransferase